LATKDEKTQKPEKIFPSLVGHPGTEGFPSWLLEMRPLDILAMTFQDVTYSKDIYEMALIVLHLRGWSYDKSHFFHHVFLSPAMSLPLKTPQSLSAVSLVVRWVLLLLILTCLFFLAHFITTAVGARRLFLLLIGVGGLSLLLINILIATDSFTLWRGAYKKITKKRLQEFLPKKEKKEKKKKKAK
jgi:hypothetical protein